jgi:hypothetical protein
VGGLVVGSFGQRGSGRVEIGGMRMAREDGTKPAPCGPADAILWTLVSRD